MQKEYEKLALIPFSGSSTYTSDHISVDSAAATEIGHRNRAHYAPFLQIGHI